MAKYQNKNKYISVSRDMEFVVVERDYRLDVSRDLLQGLK